MPKAARQPQSGGKKPGSQKCDRAARAQRRAEPEAAVDRESVRPRKRAGINSWIAELIAVYSPPMPAPVKKRKAAKLQRSHDNAVTAVAVR